MPSVRNPLSGFLLTIVVAAVAGVPIVIAATLMPYMEFLLFFLGFAMFAAGVLAGRASYMGLMGFAGGYIGGFLGLFTMMSLIFPIPWYLYLSALFPLAAALGGAISGSLHGKHLNQVLVAAPKTRRCPRCGAQVGISARHCWDCHAALPAT